MTNLASLLAPPAILLTILHGHAFINVLLGNGLISLREYVWQTAATIVVSTLMIQPILVYNLVLPSLIFLQIRQLKSVYSPVLPIIIPIILHANVLQAALFPILQIHITLIVS